MILVSPFAGQQWRYSLRRNPLQYSCLENPMDRGATIYKTDSRWEFAVWCRELKPGALWQTGGVDGVGCRREGTYVYLWLIHLDVWQKPTQYCKVIFLQLKINNFFKRSCFKATYLWLWYPIMASPSCMTIKQVISLFLDWLTPSVKWPQQILHWGPLRHQLCLTYLNGETGHSRHSMSEW